MLNEELLNELRLIAFSDIPKPRDRVAACASLARNGSDTARVRSTLYSISTDIHTPDSVKVRAIDLLDKLEASTAPKELTAMEAAAQEQSLLEQYVGTTQ